MHKTTVYLDDASYQRLQRLAKASGRTQAMIVREAIARYTAPDRRRPTSLGAGRSGRGDLADRSEELLQGFGEDA